MSAAAPRPIEISERRGISMPVVMFASVISVTATGAIGYSRLIEADNRHELAISKNAADVQEHEKRIREVERATISAADDLRWIRSMMETQQKARDMALTKAATH